MAIFHFTTATSRITSGADAFGPPADDTPAADTLIVDPSAFLIATGVGGGDGAFLANTGAWTVTVGGSIFSEFHDGILLNAGNAALSTITIGGDGTVQGRDAAISLQSSASINNAGEISAGRDANKTNAAGTNDAFTFIGTNVPFTGTAGQLHAFWVATGQFVEGDVNGDKKPDFSISLSDQLHQITLASTNFFL